MTRDSEKHVVCWHDSGKITCQKRLAQRMWKWKIPLWSLRGNKRDFSSDFRTNRLFGFVLTHLLESHQEGSDFFISGAKIFTPLKSTIKNVDLIKKECKKTKRVRFLDHSGSIDLKLSKHGSRQMRPFELCYFFTHEKQRRSPVWQIHF